MPRPVLFFRDQYKYVRAFLPNDVQTLDALRLLAGAHKFCLAHWRDVLVLSQGGSERPDSEPKEFFEGRERRHTVLVGGRGACGHCGRGCQRPGDMSAMIEFPGTRDESAVAVLGDLLNTCPLYFQTPDVPRTTLHRRHLVAAGFEPLTQVRAFTDDDVDETDIEALALVSDAARAVEVMGSPWVQGVMSTTWRPDNGRWSRRAAKASFRDLFFDEQAVRANLLKFRVRGAQAAAERKRRQDLKRENCPQCVYDCAQSPISQPKPLTREEIMELYRTRPEDREWMALFTITGYRAKFIDDDSGRRRMAIGCRPTKDGRIEVVSLIPNYDSVADLEVGEYLSDAGVAELVPRLPEAMDEDHVTMAHWALRTISGHLRWRDVRLNVNGYSKRNDILSIWLGENHVRVGSDTRATDNGGFGGRGDRIDNWRRPRFHTDYFHPYSDSILEWFGRALGACGG